MNVLEILQLIGVLLGLFQMIPAIYKNYSTRNNPIQDRAINHLSTTTIMLLTFSGLSKFPNLIKGLKMSMLSGNTENIRRSALILTGTTITFITFYGTLIIMSRDYATPTNKEIKEKVKIQISAFLFTVVLILILISFFVSIIR